MRKSIATQILESLAALLIGAGLVLIPAVPAAAQESETLCAPEGPAPTADTDHDGLDNWQEDLFGTDRCNWDTDGDGIEDGVDNCALIANNGQEDTDNDGYGIVCDCDYTGESIVNGDDLTEFAKVFLSVVDDSLLDLSHPEHPRHKDHNMNNVIDSADLGSLRLQLADGVRLMAMVDTDDDGVKEEVEVVVPGPSSQLFADYKFNSDGVQLLEN